MKIAIIDDLQTDRELLLSFCTEYMKTNRIVAEFDTFCSGEDFLAAFAPERYSIIFLDVYMGGMTGLETADRIRTKDPACLLIFVSMSTEHALESFRVHPFDYLSKPCTSERVFQLLNDALLSLSNVSRYLEVPVGRKNEKIYFSELMYAISDAHYSMLYLHSSEMIRCRVSFSQLSSHLQSDCRFLNCNRGVLLNMDYIQSVNTESFVMADGTSFPIRRSNHEAIRRSFTHYQVQKLKKQNPG